MRIGRPIRRLAVGLVCVATLAGCASFPAGRLKNSMAPAALANQPRPSVFVDAKFLQGEPGSPAAVEIPAVRPILRSAVERTLKTSGLFSSVSLNLIDQDSADVVLRMSVYDHANMAAAGFLGFIGGLTLCVLPVPATDNYTLLTEVIRKDGSTTGLQCRSDDSITTWIGLLLIPFAYNTPQKAVDTTFGYLVNDSLRQLAETNQLRVPATVSTVKAETKAEATAASNADGR